jgi:hypothetical protein
MPQDASHRVAIRIGQWFEAAASGWGLPIVALAIIFVMTIRVGWLFN